MSPRQTIAHYKITAKLGEGGMGEVWRATDTKLGRDVAIKILPESFAQDPDRMVRFEREAQVLASLNHPNIAAIYGVEERALVMELVEGPTLEERIAAGPMRLAEAMPIALQIAEALQYAHEKGIVHRDLKPANINLTVEGRVKVLDFGLAKAISNDPARSRPESSPTLTLRATEIGVILGTAAYMSPEQARGQDADRRADIWAFGVVLYEMLTGRKLFAAPTVSDSLAAVLTREPEWDRIPAQVRSVLRRCLEKDAKRRLHDIADVRLLLEETPDPAPVGQPRVARRNWLWLIAGALLSAVVVLALVRFREQPAAVLPFRFEIPPPAGSSFMQWPSRISPDGRRIAFTATTADGRFLLWVRELDSVEPHPLAGTDNAQSPFWSPDSRSIGFGADGKVRKIDASGGPPQTLCDGPDIMLGGDWSRNGVILFGSASATDGRYPGIYRVSEGAGAPSRVTELDPTRHETFHAYPSFLPDQHHFVYLRLGDAGGVYAGSLDVSPQQQSRKRIVETSFLPTYVPPMDSKAGWLLFVREDALMAERFDAGRLELEGESAALVDHLLTFRTEAYTSASANGVLLYRTRAAQGKQNLAWFDRKGTDLGRVGDPGISRGIALSPDGTRVAISHTRLEARRWGIFLLDLARNTSMQLTTPSFIADSPVWSPDGGRVIFATTRDGLRNLYEKAANGVGAETPVLESGAMKYANDWSRDGKFLLYTEMDPKTKADLWYLPLSGDRKPVAYLRTEASELQGQFSPDGHWVAYTSDESGRQEIYVQPFPLSAENGLKSKVSIAGGAQPRWRRDGRELFYLAPDRKLMAVEMTTGPQVRPLSTQALFTAPVILVYHDTQRYDVTADGKRFLINTESAEIAPSPITVVLNWTAGLRK